VSIFDIYLYSLLSEQSTLKRNLDIQA